MPPPFSSIAYAIFITLSIIARLSAAMITFDYFFFFSARLRRHFHFDFDIRCHYTIFAFDCRRLFSLSFAITFF
jgi:hypothetical protein